MEQLVARRAHNPKVTGSSPVPATIKDTRNSVLFLFQHMLMPRGVVCVQRNQVMSPDSPISCKLYVFGYSYTCSIRSWFNLCAESILI